MCNVPASLYTNVYKVKANYEYEVMQKDHKTTEYMVYPCSFIQIDAFLGENDVYTIIYELQR